MAYLIDRIKNLFLGESEAEKIEAFVLLNNKKGNKLYVLEKIHDHLWKTRWVMNNNKISIQTPKETLTSVFSKKY